MAHIDGADEAAPQREEQALWRQFIVQQRVDSLAGLNYLRLLLKRQSTQSDQ